MSQDDNIPHMLADKETIRGRLTVLRAECAKHGGCEAIYLTALAAHLLDVVACEEDPVKTLESFMDYLRAEAKSETFKQRWRNAQAAKGVAL